MTQKPIYAIAGPTASGKTALGVELALQRRRRGHQFRFGADLSGNRDRDREADRGRESAAFRII